MRREGVLTMPQVGTINIVVPQDDLWQLDPQPDDDQIDRNASEDTFAALVVTELTAVFPWSAITVWIHGDDPNGRYNFESTGSEYSDEGVLCMIDDVIASVFNSFEWIVKFG